MNNDTALQTFKPKAIALAVAVLCVPCATYAQTTNSGGAAAQHFAALDTNGDASLDEAELTVFANNTTMSTDEILEQFDSSDSGELEYGEFAAAMNALAAPAAAGVSSYQPVYVPVVTRDLEGSENERANQGEERTIENPDRGASQASASEMNSSVSQTSANEMDRSGNQAPESEMDSAESQVSSTETNAAAERRAASAEANDQRETAPAESSATANDTESEAMIAVTDGGEEIQQSPESAADTLREDTPSALATDTQDMQARGSQGSDRQAAETEELDVPPEADRVVAQGNSADQSVLNTPMTELAEASVVNATGVTIGEVADIVVDIDNQQAGIIFTDEAGEPAFALTDEVSYTGDKLIINSQGVVPTLYDSTTYDATRFTSVPVDERTLRQVLNQQSVSFR